MIRDVINSTDTLRTSVHKMLQQNLEMKKMRSKLVLNVKMPEWKKERVFIAEMFLNDCKMDLTLHGWIITGDEWWIFEYDLSKKGQSMQWESSDKPRQKMLAWLGPIKN